MTLITVKVEKIIKETQSVKTFILRSITQDSLPFFEAGAHIKVHLPLEEDDASYRAYSLYEGDDSTYKIAVLCEKEGRGGSLYMHDLNEGDCLTISEPQNDFPLSHNAEEVILIAGGIGITPIYAMAQELKAGNIPFSLHFGARSHADMPLLDKCIAIADARLALYFDGESSSASMGLEHILKKPTERKHVYICGPSGLIEAVIETANRLGWSSSNVHFERFSAPALINNESAFNIVLHSSGETLRIEPDKTILDTLIDSGYDPLYDCKAGNCGICTANVVSCDSELDHRDSYLSDEKRQAGKQICICVSRTKGGTVVLDL